MFQMPLTLVRKCDECSYEWEIEWDGLTTPVANGHEPTDWDDTGWVWILYHGPRDCNSSLTIDRAEFDSI